MKSLFFISLALFACEVLSKPKVYEPRDGGFEPSHRYYESNLPDYHQNQQNYTTKPERKDTKESRFGIIPISTTSYGSSSNGVQGSGYGNVGLAFKPMNLDIGGVALGAILGIGLVLIVPKIANIIGGGYGGYRSLDGEMSEFAEVLARIDDSLGQNNIDSTSCIQRTVCSYVNSARKNVKSGEASGLDELVASLASNRLVTHMLDGTSVKQAVETGKTGEVEQCSANFPKCPLSKESLLKVLGSLLPA